MRKLYLILFLILISLSHLKAEDDSYWYLSPGLTVSVDFSGNFLFSPKVSLGLYKNMQFFNITVGHVSSFAGEKYSYYYIEPQYGVLSGPNDFEKIELFYGGGLGIAIFENCEEDKIAFKGSLFAGFGLFVNTSFVLGKRKTADVGMQAVFPISFKKDFFGFKY